MSGSTEADITTQSDGRQSAGAIFWRTIAAFMVIGGGALAYLAVQQALDEALLLVLFAFYAGVGVFFLLCSAFGVCSFTADHQRRLPVEVMLDQLTQAVVLTNEKGAVRYMNAGYRRMTGNRRLTPDVLLARDERAAKVIYQLNIAVKEKREAVAEIHLADSLYADGEKEQEAAAFVYSVTAKPFRLDDYAMVMWIITDLTEQNRRQDVFVGNLQAAVSHLDYAPAGFVSWDREGCIDYLNATLAGWLGVDLATFMPGHMALGALVGVENAAYINQQMMQDPAKPIAVIDLAAKDNGQQLRQWRFYAAHGAGAACSRAIVLPADMMQSHSLLNEIINTDQRALHFEDYFDISPIALAVIDDTGEIQRANSRFLQLFNLDYDMSLHQGAQGFLAALDEEDGKQVGLALQQILSGKSAGISPIDAVLPGETERSIRLYIDTVGHDLAGHPAVVISVIETTQQRALEQHMEHSQKMQAVGQLAGGIAHDFNNVLTAIIMSCDLLLGNHRSSDPSHQDIMNIKNNANRAASLVQQLLAFSRRQTLRPEVLDLSEMLVGLRMLVTRLVGNNIRFQIEHGRALWPVKADQAELGRVIMNLAANARDAMPDGGTLTIRTANIIELESRNFNYQGFTPGDYVLIEVSDTGSGIATDIMGKIFDPFFTTKAVGKGTGLGLSMVYGIITQTGGYIHCDSEIGQGTRFSIYLPRYHEAGAVRQDEEKALKYDEPEKKAVASQPVDLSGSATVLLVEDEDAVRMGGVKALQSRGYTVLEAASGIEALEIIDEKKGAIDIVVSDVVMPEMDGPTLFKELQQLYPDIKFIFVSGYAQEAFAKKLPADATFAFLAKPFSLKQLATAVKEALVGSEGAVG